jgi:hypothetical protein
MVVVLAGAVGFRVLAIVLPFLAPARDAPDAQPPKPSSVVATSEREGAGEGRP